MIESVEALVAAWFVAGLVTGIVAGAAAGWSLASRRPEPRPVEDWRDEIECTCDGGIFETPCLACCLGNERTA